MSESVKSIDPTDIVGINEQIRAWAGDGEEIFCEYSHTLDPDTWTVEENNV